MPVNYQNIMPPFYQKLQPLLGFNGLSLTSINEGIHLCNNTLYLLRNQIENYQFVSMGEEIDFFRNVKSEPLGYLIYFSEVRYCLLRMPKVGAQQQLGFLKKKVRMVNKFFGVHWDFIQYMEQDFEYLDEQYFTREKQHFPVYAPPETSYLDPKFFTSHDLLWARVKAMQLFAKYLKKVQLGMQRKKRKGFAEAHPLVLHWTGSKTALVELIYALQHAHAINDGHEDIAKIVAGFEQLFDVKIENVYKTYGEIRARKDKKARFVRTLWEQLLKQMEEEDGLTNH